MWLLGNKRKIVPYDLSFHNSKNVFFSIANNKLYFNRIKVSNDFDQLYLLFYIDYQIFCNLRMKKVNDLLYNYRICLYV